MCSIEYEKKIFYHYHLSVSTLMLPWDNIDPATEEVLACSLCSLVGLGCMILGCFGSNFYLFFFLQIIFYSLACK